jgi:hypothetical protein
MSNSTCVIFRRSDLCAWGIAPRRIPEPRTGAVATALSLSTGDTAIFTPTSGSELFMMKLSALTATSTWSSMFVGARFTMGAAKLY